MASSGWFKGIVKAVPSGDSLVIMGIKADGIPPEKSITIAGVIAPRLARRDTNDEPFAWDSREFLRKMCIGKEVTFRVDHVVPQLGNREFGSVFLGSTNLALEIVKNGWAKVRQPGGQNAEKSPYLAELSKAEEQAQQQGLGMWNKSPGAAEASVRSIPPSAVGDASSFDASGLVKANKGKLLHAIVEQVRDGSSFRVYLLPSFQFVQVHLAGVQAPSMGRRAPQATAANAANGDAKEDGTKALTSAQKLAALPDIEPDEWAREAKHFTESRILHREVRILLEGNDKYNTLFGCLSYVEGDKSVDLALELVKQGLARYTDWSANMLEEEEKRRLKAAELQAKRDRIRSFTNFVIPPSNSKAIKNDVFTGKVIEVVSGDCVVVADDSTPVGSPNAERRVNLSSILAPKATRERSDPFAREAKEFLRTRLIGQQVHVSMEYSRTIQLEAPGTQSEGGTRVLDFGSVFLVSAPKNDLLEPPLPGQPQGANVAEMVVANGFAQVVRHRDFDDRSHYYDNLLAAEKKAMSSKKGIHGNVTAAAVHVNDLTQANAQKVRQFLPFLQRSRRLSAVVDFVLSGVRAPGRGEDYSDEAIAFMRRRILQRDVEIEVETVDRTGTFLGSLWEGKTNVAVSLLEAGLAKMQAGFADRIPEGHLLMQAQENAKQQRLKIWANEEVEVPVVDFKQEQLEVRVTEVLGGGRFYVQSVKDSKLSIIQQQLESLNLTEKPTIGFQPKKNDLVLAHFDDGSWYRATVVSTPKQPGKDGYEVFYIDYGNAETVPLSRLRPMDASVAGTTSQGLAQLCSLAYIKVPDLEDDFGVEAAHFLSAAVNERVLTAKVEEKDSSGVKGRGQGAGTRLIVILEDKEQDKSINAAMLEAGLARLEKAGKYDRKEKRAALDKLSEYQERARKSRSYIWQYGDVGSDDEEQAPTKRAAGGAGRRSK